MSNSILSPAGTAEGESTPTFSGFDPLTANYVYCPNQFFDVCLAHQSRGCVRLVAYLLRKTLGWLDADGNPIHEHVTVSYNDLTTKARISRGATRKAIAEAIAGRYITCVHKGSPSSANHVAQSASFALLWDPDADYTTDPDQFSGFYTKEGHRTPIPNAFFDYVIPNETLAVVRVVGSVLRHTVGYETQFGRRPSAPLSFTYLQRYTQIRDRSTLSAALHHALAADYIQCVKEGRFDPRSPCAATYAVKWRSKASSETASSKSRPVAVQKPDQQSQMDRQFKKPTSSGSETRPGMQFKKPTTEKTVENNTLKQQQAVVDKNEKGYELLIGQGIDHTTATQLSKSHSVEQITQQITWLPLRKPTKNAQGMFRKALEEGWSEPTQSKYFNRQPSPAPQRNDRQDGLAKQQAAAHKNQQQQQRTQHLRHWRTLSEEQQAEYFQQTVAQTSSHTTRTYLLRSQDLAHPPMQVLAVMADAERIGAGNAS